ncbi:MAG: glycosyltransferase family 4 protein [Candidatus Aminicenantaceae bacterium]
MALFHIDAGKGWRGGQRQSFYLARELKRKGFPFFYVVQPKRPLYQKALEADLPVLPLKIRHEFDVIASLILARTMKKNHCVLVHFHDAHSVAVGSAAASIAKVPIKIISRRVDFSLRQNVFSRWKYRKNVDVIVAVSEGVKKVLISDGINSDSVEVIPDCTDFSRFEGTFSPDYLRKEFSFDPDDYLVGIVAHLAGHKGHKYLISAAKFLKEHTDKVKILIVGEGSLEQDLKRQARELMVEDIVHFLGFREDVPQILHSLDLFVLSSYLEGFGSSILDAMACRLPVVATRTGGIPEVVINEETGLLVPTRDPLSLAKAILRVYRDRELATRLAQRGYEFVRQKFSTRVIAENVINLYEKLAAEKGVELYT